MNTYKKPFESYKDGSIARRSKIDNSASRKWETDFSHKDAAIRLNLDRNSRGLFLTVDIYKNPLNIHLGVGKQELSFQLPLDNNDVQQVLENPIVSTLPEIVQSKISNEISYIQTEVVQDLNRYWNNQHRGTLNYTPYTERFDAPRHTNKTPTTHSLDI